MIFKDGAAADDIRAPRKKIRQLVASISSGERAAKSVKGSTVNVIFTDDRAMKNLNRQYRDKDKTTDVLSFRYPGDDNDESTDSPFGEIYISVPRAALQATEYGHSLSSEILRLTCHGLLHLLGYRHDNESSAVEMQAREARYLSAIGNTIGNAIETANG